MDMDFYRNDWFIYVVDDYLEEQFFFDRLNSSSYLISFIVSFFFLKLDSKNLKKFICNVLILDFFFNNIDISSNFFCLKKKKKSRILSFSFSYKFKLFFLMNSIIDYIYLISSKNMYYIFSLKNNENSILSRSFFNTDCLFFFFENINLVSRYLKPSNQYIKFNFCIDPVKNFFFTKSVFAYLGLCVI